MESGIILRIEKISPNDGLGLRTVVFFKGCPLACRWCHNPEGIAFTQRVWWEARKCTRQDRKAKARDPISAKLVADLITTAGADRVLTMDLHAAQIQGFFDIPVDNLLGSPLFVDYFKSRFGDDENTMVVSPDVGSVARARAFAQKLGMTMAIVDKRRQKANSSEVMSIIGDVKGKRVILLDDMVDTAGSLCGAIEREAVDPALYGEKSRAAVAQTHGMRDDDAVTAYCL